MRDLEFKMTEKFICRTQSEPPNARTFFVFGFHPFKETNERKQYLKFCL
jgi:hypothetical protein